MSRFAYIVALGFAVFAFWMWQSEDIHEIMFDSDTTAANQPEAETRQPLTPTEKSAYADAIKTAISEKLEVYKGRLRLSADILGGTVYVPISLISVSCDTLYGVALKAPGSEGGEAAPVEMALVGDIFDSDDNWSLQATVDDALDGAEFLDEICRMVIDELERLAAQ